MTICEEANGLVGGDRMRDYQHPYQNFGKIAKLWTAYHGVKFTREDVGMMMALVKIARHKATPKRDNLVDLAGYAQATDMATARHPVVTK